MIEVGNRLLEDVLRKSREGLQDWDLELQKSVKCINLRAMKLHLGIKPDMLRQSLKAVIGPSAELVRSWITNLENHERHAVLIESYLIKMAEDRELAREEFAV